ncbi:uncharacterized protein F4812DRAFT_436635 [Daldinia caldariorum]|uniref:uncharacterized protein n=1 Tax=Daldinia caldariorum TaxID=326644 RepID=UPI002007DB52|nr:uncharacterized protein F4812DRAFT_436635 [Daldinia caldariorum]KAI1465558.1 hypothetical protein F4812DRAFT_436635 [Daldinia caldariorum]
MPKAFKDYTDKDLAGTVLSLSIPVEGIPKEALTTVFAECFQMYDDSLFDEPLWERFKEDFEGWTVNHFQGVNQYLQCMGYEHLMYHGVHISKGKSTFSLKLYEILTAKEWPQLKAQDIAKIRQYAPKKLISLCNPVVAAEIARQREIPQYYPPLADALVNLVTIYHNDEYKFGGDKYDFLDEKLKVFKHHCHKAGVCEYQWDDAIFVMLKGRALQYYYDHLVTRNGDRKYTFNEMIKMMEDFFYTFENYQTYFMDQHTTTIYSVQAENPNKNLADCVEILIEKVQRIHKGISIHSGHNGLLLMGNILFAVQGHRAFDRVLIRPSEKFDGICLDLRAAANSYVRQQTINRGVNTSIINHYIAFNLTMQDIKFASLASP